MGIPSGRVAAVKFFIVLWSVLLTFMPAVQAEDTDEITILYYESFGLSAPVFDAAALPAGAELGPIHFDAFGQRFTLEPEKPNGHRQSGRTSIRGTLAGLPDSWFSLVRRGADISGIVFDGRETYLIEPTDRIAAHLTALPPADAPPNSIFRLEDLLLPEGLLSCAVEDHDHATTTDGQRAYRQLTSELLASGVEISARPNLPLRVGVVGDLGLHLLLGPTSDAEITSIFDMVGTIIDSELGLEVVVDDIFVASTSQQDPFTNTLNASDLLEELSLWRFENQADLGHTHMLTNRTLVNDEFKRLAGISYLGEPGRTGICYPTTGASLSKYSNMMTLMSLIVTHELGHNLGASHDSDIEGICPDIPNETLIMAPKISNQTTPEFSDCSLEDIDALLAQASCLYAPEEPDTTPPSSGNGEIDDSGGGGSGGGGGGNSSGGGGGGGGSLSWYWLTLWIAGLYLRRRRIRLR